MNYPFGENFGIFLVFAIIDLVFKGFALWKAAHNNQRNWFVALLVINTFGLLPLLYIKFFQERRTRN